MATVNVVVVTKVQSFPADTVEGKFAFSISDAVSGDVVASSESDLASASFADIAPGSYVASVSKNGVSASTTFVVEVPVVSFNVPDSITVTIG